MVPYRRLAGDRNDDQSFLFRLMAGGVFKSLVCEAVAGKPNHVHFSFNPYNRYTSTAVMQLCDDDDFGINFGGGDLFFWHHNTYELGQPTNGSNQISFHFVEPAEGPCALNNGEYGGFVLTAFQVLLVRHFDGLCSS
jgi:hypothetical protein